MSDEIETLYEWNLANRCCRCMMQPLLSLSIESQSIQMWLCAFAMPVFEKMTEEQKDARYKELDISEVYSATTSSEDKDFSGGPKSKRNATTTSASKTSFKQENNKSYDFLCDAVKISSSREVVSTSTSSTTYPPGSSSVNHSGTNSITISASGGRKEDAKGIKIESSAGTDEYGNSYSHTSSNPYIFDGYSETQFSDITKFENGSTFILSTSYSTGSNTPERTESASGSSTITRNYKIKTTLNQELDGKPFSEDMTIGSLGPSENNLDYGTKRRIRFVIGASWKGNTCVFTYDVVTIPRKWTAWKALKKVHDAWKVAKDLWEKSKDPDKGPSPREPQKPGNEPTRPSWERNKKIKWHGPGKNEQSDPSWRTNWITLDPPIEPGTKSLVNIRFEKTPDNPWGTLPETIGIGYEPESS